MLSSPTFLYLCKNTKQNKTKTKTKKQKQNKTKNKRKQKTNKKWHFEVRDLHLTLAFSSHGCCSG